MKTPDEIKNGLKACGTLDGDCENCPYDDGLQLFCVDRLRKDAFVYFQHLESRLAQVERERDAAVMDVTYVAFAPEVCKHYKYCQTIDNDGDKGCFGPICCEDYEWRGPCPENTQTNQPEDAKQHESKQD